MIFAKISMNSGKEIEAFLEGTLEEVENDFVDTIAAKRTLHFDHKMGNGRIKKITINTRYISSFELIER
ncbi:hypothetical protein JFL43_05200 [Viridibacillus sp. YIM B01967]|uniref:Uncharacterized protein n=1 Tax=Viridibacillus soli TaxID=2798301 RepID=A0ABS1H4B3_9BACL|nr:hypothetical protein [Viridibacillus soli]MBK3494260.1 hypothetical protein [Viridibacillus soli]